MKDGQYREKLQYLFSVLLGAFVVVSAIFAVANGQSVRLRVFSGRTVIQGYAAVAIYSIYILLGVYLLWRGIVHIIGKD